MSGFSSAIVRPIASMFAVRRSLDHARDSVPPSMKKPKSSSYAPKPMFQQSTLYSVSASAVCTPPLPCVTVSVWLSSMREYVPNT